MESNDDSSTLLEELHSLYGPLMGGKELAVALGFKNTAAFRQALRRGNLPVKVFVLPSRKGKFALTRDVSQWLETLASPDNLKQEVSIEK